MPNERRVRQRRFSDQSSLGPVELLAQAVHDARQQAAALSALLEAVAREDFAVTPQTVSGLARSARQLTELLEHALDGRSRVERVAVWSVIEDMVAAARVSSGVRIETAVDESACVLADVGMLRRAIGNLVDNAVRAAGRGGCVRIAIGPSSAGVRVVVEDSGPGFGPAAPRGRASMGFSVLADFLGAVRGSLEIQQSDLGGALIRVTVPERAAEDDTVNEGSADSAGLAV